MPLSKPLTMVVLSLTGLIGSVHNANVRDVGWEKMILRDAIGGDGIHVQIVRRITSQQEQIQIQCLSKSMLAAEEAREVPVVYIQNIGKCRGICNNR